MDESHVSPHVPLLSNGNVVKAESSSAPLASDDVDIDVPEDPVFVTGRSTSPEKRNKFVLDEDDLSSPTSLSPSVNDVHGDQCETQPPAPYSAPPFERNLSEPSGGASSHFRWSSMTKRLRNPSGGKGMPMAHTEPTLRSGGDSPPCTSPSPKPPPKKVRKYYQQQSDLLDSYKADNETIQEFERRRQRTASEAEKLADVAETEAEHDENVFATEGDEILLDTISRSSRASGRSVEPRVKIATGRPHGPDDDKDDEEKHDEDTDPATRRLAAATLFINVLLLLAKAVAVYLSGSFSIISSLVDSSVDITSGLAIWLTARAIKKRDPYLYPRGRTRLEPIALVIVSVIMGVASVQMIVQSIEAIIRQTTLDPDSKCGDSPIDPVVDWPTFGIMLSTIVVKFVLMLLCRRHRNNSSINVLAQDHRNDCISNSVALLCAFLATRYWIYLDPIGAIVVSVYIAGTWFMTGKEHIIMLSGRTAEPGFINRIIKVCMDHDKRIEFIDTVYVYHFGTKFLVEVHIVLERTMSLQMAHDISERLQINIEHLPEVERAFVHCDYEAQHRPEDEHKVV